MDKSKQQEIYSLVRSHLLKQNERSICHGDGCAYRGDGGGKCAIGCLIKDSNYDEYIEHQSLWRTDKLRDAKAFDEVDKQDALVRSIEASCAIKVDDDWREFLRDLQEVHDNAEVWEWKDSLDELALQYGLEAA